MKILIIGTPRSGTSSLVVGIGESLKYKIISEPFNYTSKDISYNLVKDGKFVIPENCALKNIIRQQPKEMSEINFIDFYDLFVPLFDKVIVITRIRQDLLIESYLQALETGVWHDKWVKTHEFDDYEEEHQRMETNLKMLHIVAKRYNLPITYYEELYSGDKEKINKILKQWDIPGLHYNNMFEYINPEKKYRMPDNFTKRLI